MKILIVDDEVWLQEVVARALTREGHAVRGAASLAEARQELETSPPELVVLDIALGDGSGVDFCREVRAGGHHMPIILLTAHHDVPRRLEGFDAGADDFMGKPFAVAELRARVRALGRRGPTIRPETATIGSLTIDVVSRRATRDEEEIPITAREWAVLDMLVASRGRVLGRIEILDAIWGDSSVGSNASLEVIVARIRRKLGSETIRTIRGEGYAIGGA
jgi:DNA-binding response OmpR family regulator